MPQPDFKSVIQYQILLVIAEELVVLAPGRHFLADIQSGVSLGVEPAAVGVLGLDGIDRVPEQFKLLGEVTELGGSAQVAKLINMAFSSAHPLDGISGVDPELYGLASAVSYHCPENIGSVAYVSDVGVREYAEFYVLVGKVDPGFAVLFFGVPVVQPC